MKEKVLSNEELEKKLDRLQFTSVQKQQLKELAEAMAKILEMPFNVVNGLYLYTLIDWQNQIKMTFAETESKVGTLPEERMKQLKQVQDIFRIKNSKYLQRKKKLHLLEKALDAAKKVYIEKYAYRPPDSNVSQ